LWAPLGASPRIGSADVPPSEGARGNPCRPRAGRYTHGEEWTQPICKGLFIRRACVQGAREERSKKHKRNNGGVMGVAASSDPSSHVGTTRIPPPPSSVLSRGHWPGNLTSGRKGRWPEPTRTRHCVPVFALGGGVRASLAGTGSRRVRRARRRVPGRLQDHLGELGQQLAGWWAGWLAGSLAGGSGPSIVCDAAAQPAGFGWH